MPSLAFGTFFDGQLARQERACLGSFVRAGHDVSLFSYDPVALPDGVIGRDAAEILPASALFRDSSGGRHHGTVAQFSNQFRYTMIAKTGLAWIDTDVICLRANWPAADWLLARQDHCLINTAVLGLPRDHPLVARAIDVTERLRGVPVWSLTGPHLITTLVGEWGLEPCLMPTDALYPLHYSRAGELLRPLRPGERFHIPDGALCIHLWNEVLRLKGHDKAAGPLPDTPLAALLDFAEQGTIVA
jgi:hypothetical protein